MNRADPTLLQYMQYHIDKVNPDRGSTYKLAKQFGQQLIDNCRQVVGQAPLYKDGEFRFGSRIILYLRSFISNIPDRTPH